ncbi:GAD-like domain-containing protein [Nocardia sp. FBN12]|uniref:GAD-like domain-containing protein n=1 Tax=Nocardia sp. FBN12 TaxID=3419766 RepID=UPI003D0018EA
MSVRSEGRRNYLVRIPRELAGESGRFSTTVPIAEGYQTAAINLIAESTGHTVSLDEIEWNIAAEPRYSDAVVTLFDTLERRLTEKKSDDLGGDDIEWSGDVEESMDEVDDLLRSCPDHVEGYADVRELLLESMLSMMDDFEGFQFDEEVLWSHGRVLNSLPTDLSTMPDDWRYRYLENFAFMAYPHDYVAIDELVDECVGWDEIKRIAEFYEYIYRNFDARIDSLDDSVQDYVRDSSVGPTNYTSSHDEYGFSVRIPYVVICYLHERGELRQFITRQTEFDELWTALGATGKQLPLEVHDFLSRWNTSWTGEPLEQVAVPESYFDEYSDLPGIVHTFWREVGFAGFAKGLLWVCDPHEWQPIVDEWLAGLDLPETHRAGQIPLFRTAFGEIICFKAEMGNLVRIDPLTPEVVHIARGVDFGALVLALGSQVSGDTHWRGAFGKIVAKLGPLDHSTIYAFDPLPFVGENPRGRSVVYRTETAARSDARSAMSTIRAAATAHLKATSQPFFSSFGSRED